MMSGVHKNNLVLHSQIGDLVEEFHHFFNDVDFNFKASDTFIRMVMISLSVEFLLKNTKVINYKDPVKKIYFIKSGNIGIFDRNSQWKIMTYCEGSYFGDI